MRAIVLPCLVILWITKYDNIPLCQVTASAATSPSAGGAVSLRPQISTSDEVLELEKHHRSHLRVERSNLSVDVYLAAADENAVALDASFCGGQAGAVQFTGHYQLISVANHAVVSRLDLDPDVSLVEKIPHDDLRLYREPKTGQNLMALFQYGSCNTEMVQFFSVDPSAQLYAIPFLDKDGRAAKQQVIGPDGAVPHLANGASAFCSYSNDSGYNYCAAYVFDGANFQEVAKWMTRDRRQPAQGLNAVSQATATLFDFLSELSLGNYQAAAYYFAGNAGPGPDKSKALEAYCTTGGGQCLEPATIQNKMDAAAAGALRFQVSLQTFEFKPFQIRDRATFDFRVAKVAGEFKVLDLPPRLP